MKTSVLSIFLLVLFLLVGCTKNQTNNSNAETTKSNETSKSQEETGKANHITILKLNQIFKDDSITFKKELERFNYKPISVSKDFHVYSDKASYDFVKSQNEKIGIGYYLLLEKPTIIKMDDVKSLYITFPISEYYSYLHEINEIVKKSSNYTIASENDFYAEKNAIITTLKFKKIRYNLGTNNYELNLYNNYACLKINYE